MSVFLLPSHPRPWSNLMVWKKKYENFPVLQEFRTKPTEPSI